MSDTLQDLLFLIFGFAITILGGELLVRGASVLARRLGMSSLLIGLTVVAFGTSAPELAVSLGGVLNGSGGLALGNVIGSNIFNVAFILGLAALVQPLSVTERLIKMELPLVVGLSILVLLLGLDGSFDRLNGLLFLGLGVAYSVWLWRTSRAEGPPPNLVVAGEPATEPPRLSPALLKILLGLVFLGVGAKLVVTGAIGIGHALGISDLVLGITVVAVGTSLPEAATSVVAAMRGERDMAVGNVVGSNLFNLLLVLGGVSTIGGNVPVPAEALWVDLPVMIAVAFFCLPAFRTGWEISRLEGALFFGFWLTYTSYLIWGQGIIPHQVITGGALLLCLISLYIFFGPARRDTPHPPPAGP